MPQLMPLMWVFSSLMVVMIFISGCIVYSSSKKDIKMDYLGKGNKVNKLWFW